jgi:hypothetical protein
VAQINRGRVSVPAQAASSGSHHKAPGSAGGYLLKKWFFGEKKHIDQERREQEAQDLRNIKWLMDNADEQTFLEYAKGLNPNATTTELQSLIAVFHEQRKERERQRRL